MTFADKAMIVAALKSRFHNRSYMMLEQGVFVKIATEVIDALPCATEPIDDSTQSAYLQGFDKAAKMASDIHALTNAVEDAVYCIRTGWRKCKVCEHRGNYPTTCTRGFGGCPDLSQQILQKVLPSEEVRKKYFETKEDADA